ncbi:uncharacterized protein [Aquarana catesbeiana]|uniref:uncharacterized protein n=1 Tax=Aquarana catesbeiana TaxID=8400 RepID=UPI003CC9DB6E
MQSKGNPVHPKRKTRKSEGPEMELGKEDEKDIYINLTDLNLQRQKKSAKAKGNCDEEGAYGNLCDPDLLRKKNANAKAAKNSQIRLILILMVLLIFLFLVQVVFIGILFTFYKNMAEEQSHLKETGENMAKEQSRLRETDKNITEGQSRLRETGENMAKEQSRLRETVTNELKKPRNLNNEVAVMNELKKSRNLNNEVAGSIFNKIQRNLGAVGKLLEEVSKMNSSAQPLCDRSWRHYGLSCYYKSTKKEPLNSAKEDCEKNKAHLVIINGEDEMNFLRGFSEKQSWWIGLRMVNGAWEWFDGTSYEMTPKFWGKGQPNNSSMTGYTGGQDCVQFNNENGWDDRHCVTNYKYICEKEIP